jgi:O-antigen/teichoic acid export membrane protein
MSDTSKASVSAVAKQSFAYMLSTWAGRFFSIISTPILTRILTPEDYGVVDFIATIEVAGFLLLSLGLDSGFRRYYIGSDDQDERYAYLGTGYLVWFVMNLVLVALMFFNAEWIAVNILDAPTYASVVQVAAFATFGTSLMRMTIELLKDNMDVRVVTLTSVLNLAVRLSLAVFFVAVLMTGVVGMYSAAIIATFMTFFLQLYFGRGYLGFAFSWRKLVRMLRFGLPLVPSRLATYLIFYADRYFITIFLTLADLGIYAVGNKIANLTALITSGFVSAWGPYVLNTYREPKAHDTFRRVFRLYASALTILSVGLSIFSIELLFVFTTPDYVDAYQFVPFLVYALLHYSVGIYFSVGIDISEKTYHRTWISVIVIVLNPLLNILLIPEYGVLGASWATLISYMLYGYVSLLITERIYPIGFAVGRITALQLVGALVIVLAYLLQDVSISLPQIAWKSALMVMFLFAPFALRLLHWHEVIGAWHLLKRRLRRASPSVSESPS